MEHLHVSRPPARVITRTVLLAALMGTALTACTAGFVASGDPGTKERITRSLNLNPGTVGQDNATDREGTPVER